ncbi:MAG: pseudouridine synthase [Bacteroidia bacterium]
MAKQNPKKPSKPFWDTFGKGKPAPAPKKHTERAKRNKKYRADREEEGDERPARKGKYTARIDERGSSRDNRKRAAKGTPKFAQKKVEDKRPYEELTPAERAAKFLVRLNRFIAQSGVCARREADKLILAGKITVNGKVVTELGTKVNPKFDTVLYEGKALKKQKLVYYLYNKPRNVLTTTKDDRGRSTVIDKIEEATKERVFPVGRLDRNTTGLIILTNDGNLAKRLTHPSHTVRKLYHARLDKGFDPKHLKTLKKGVELEDGLAKANKIGFVAGGEDNQIGIEVHLGKNRIVRRMFESLGYKVEALDRVMIAHLTKKRLPRSQWRELTSKEVDFLKMI